MVDRYQPLRHHSRPSSAPLNRNQACITCRQRKVRCDAHRPACTACLRSAAAQGLDKDAVLCEYPSLETLRAAKANRSGSSKNVSTKRIAELEEKISLLEQVINKNPTGESSDSTLTETSSALTTSQPSMNFFEFNAAVQMDLPTIDPLVDFSLLKDQAPLSLPNFNIPTGVIGFDSGSTYEESNEASINIERHGPSFPRLSEPLRSGDNKQQNSANNPWHSHLSPSWPSSLPPRLLLERMISIFFKYPNAASGVINQAKFLTSLSQPTNHPRFPPPFLIHAVCAVACLLPDAAQIGLDREPYWRAFSSPGIYHAHHAKEGIDQAFLTGRQPFRIIQAIVLLCIHAHSFGQFIQVWCYSGIAMRIATPIGLNHLECSMVQQRFPEVFVPSMSPGKFLLPPPGDEGERRERAHTFWALVACERLCTANTGWPHCLSDLDITTMLPALTCDSDNYYNPKKNFDALSPESSRFFTYHPADCVGSTQLYFKAIVLLSQATAFVQRNQPSTLVKDPATGKMMSQTDPRQSTQYKEIEGRIASYRLSLPEPYKDVTKRTEMDELDTHLVLVHMLPLIAYIVLHEPYTHNPDDEISLERCVSAARGILSIIFLIWSTGKMSTMLAQTYTLFCFNMAGRILIRKFHRDKKEDDDHFAKTTEAEINVFISVLAHGNPPPIAKLMVNTLKMMKEDPELCGIISHIEVKLRDRMNVTTRSEDQTAVPGMDSDPLMKMVNETESLSNGNQGSPSINEIMEKGIYVQSASMSNSESIVCPGAENDAIKRVLESETSQPTSNSTTASDTPESIAHSSSPNAASPSQTQHQHQFNNTPFLSRQQPQQPQQPFASMAQTFPTVNAENSDTSADVWSQKSIENLDFDASDMSWLNMNFG